MGYRSLSCPLLALLSVLGIISISGCGGMKGAPPFLGVALEGHPITTQKLELVTREFPVPPEIVLFYLQWPSSPERNNFPTMSLDAIRDAGAIPCLTWEPMYYEGDQEHTIGNRLILDGNYDPYITAFALEAKRWGTPFIIRFAHEMNLSRYHWGTAKAHYGPASPDLYRRMHRHVVDIFRRQGATNVLWAFAPNAESVPDLSYDADAGWNRIANYYPGNDYVDILGVDGYNWGTSKTMTRDGWESRWLSFGEIFTSPLRQLRELSPHKPLIVFETASTGQGGDKDRWLREALGTAAEWEVDGFVWFQVKKEEDWRIGKGALPDFPLREGQSQKWLQGIMEAGR